MAELLTDLSDEDIDTTWTTTLAADDDATDAGDGADADDDASDADDDASDSDTDQADS